MTNAGICGYGITTIQNAVTAPVVALPSTPSQINTILNTVTGIAPAIGAGGNKAKEIPKTDTKMYDSKTTLPSTSDLKYYSWNLPPHKWSQPVEPSSYDSSILDTAKSIDPNAAGWYRRGRIYWYSRVDTNYMNSNETNYGELSGITDPNVITEGAKGNSNKIDKNDPRYGFQFLWNPEVFSTVVTVNPDITPTSKDAFVKAVGAFPSSEMLSVSIVLDRTNDMFCLRSANAATQGFVNFENFTDYYKDYMLAPASDSPDLLNHRLFIEKVKNLAQLGTLADLEYLYKAINGPGWTNIANGRETSDIGFISPALLKIEIGPSGYLGYVTAISVDHTAFTKSMIPIRTNVTITFNLMATAGISSKG